MPSNEPFIHRFEAMTVPCEIQLFAPTKLDVSLGSIVDDIIFNTRRLESRYNFYSESSWLSQKVNQRNTSVVTLDEESLVIFQHLEAIATLSDDVFDATVGSVKALLRREPNLSHSEAFQRLKPAMGKQSWRLKKNKLTIEHPETEFDLGGVIKEYAVDQAVEIAKSYGITSMLVNFGGDIFALGRKPDGTLFNVAVLNPKKSTEPYFALPIENAALTTSAHYERRFQFGDKNTSHILSETETEKKILSVTVVANTVLEAGVLSTALTLQPALTMPENSAVIFIDDQLTIHQDTEFLLR